MYRTPTKQVYQVFNVCVTEQSLSKTQVHKNLMLKQKKQARKATIAQLIIIIPHLVQTETFTAEDGSAGIVSCVVFFFFTSHLQFVLQATHTGL